MIKNSEIRNVFLVTICLLVICSPYSMAQSYSRWVSDKGMEFKKTSSNSWINTKWNIVYKQIRSENNEVVLFDGKNKFWIKLTSSACSTSFNQTVYKIFESGVWDKNSIVSYNVDTIKSNKSSFHKTNNSQVRDPRRKDIANVFWNGEYPLYSLESDIEIQPNSENLYDIWYACNEEPTPHHILLKKGQNFYFYKFINEEECEKWCNQKKYHK